MSTTHHYRNLLPALLALVLLASFVPVAQAQWQWRDETGRKVFSDRPPPQSVPESAILSKPASARRVPATEAPAPTPSPAATGNTSGLPAVARSEAELKAEAQAQKRVKEEETRIAAQWADNCERAKKSLMTVNSGMRIATLNDKGEREFMDEKAISSERQRLESIIRSDCSAG